MPLAELENDRWMHRGDRILKWHELAAGKIEDGTVLDVGGGNVSFAAYLQDRGIENIDLVDISFVGMERAKTLGSHPCRRYFKSSSAIRRKYL